MTRTNSRTIERCEAPADIYHFQCLETNRKQKTMKQYYAKLINDYDDIHFYHLHTDFSFVRCLIQNAEITTLSDLLDFTDNDVYTHCQEKFSVYITLIKIGKVCDFYLQAEW